MAILDQYGNPIQQQILSEPQTVKVASLHWEYANHPARGLTPVRLAQILAGAEAGHLEDQTNLFLDMMEKDGHLYAEMAKRMRAILTVDWSIEAPRNANQDEIDLAAFLTDIVADLPNLPDILFNALDAIGHGFSCLEIEWQLLGKTWIPKALHHRPQSWFRVAPGEQNTLLLRDNAQGSPLIPFGWVTHIHKAKPGVLARGGLHRILAWPYLFKNYSVRDLAELLEIYGLPIRIGKYPSGTSEKEKATLLRAVTQLGHSAAGIIPEGMLIEFQAAAQGNHDPYMAMVTWADLTMSKVILGGTLSSQADGKTATHALGKVHDGARLDIRASDAKQLAATLTRDLLYPLAVLNGYAIDDMRRMPKMVFDVREESDFAMIADALPKLTGVGMPIPVSYVQRKLAIPAPQEGEAVLTPPTTAPSSSAPVPEPATIKPQPGQAALTMRTEATPTPVDPLTDQLSTEAKAVWQAVLNHIKALADSATDLADLQNKLLTAYGSLPQADLVKVITEGMMVAHLNGMLDVQQASRAG